ncbi:MAG TPA: GAF domain-containing sensor histidine kinase, partial [Ktedonobacterales bacterium]|nr:GAF domain-containing sensor histidine kinase [Ktedonobacterales bacterium]
MARKPAGASSAEQLRRRNRELSILIAIARALNQSVDLDQALRATLAQVAELLDLRTGWIWLLDEETGESYLAAAQDLPPGLAANPRHMEGSCYCLDTFRAGDLAGAANVNVVTCSRLKRLMEGTGGLRYHASIPLYAYDKKLGVLNVASPDWRELSPDDLELLHAIGDLLGIAVERARLFLRSAQMGALEERNRLAREIHDTLAQGLAAIALRLESVDALLEAGAEGQDTARMRATVEQALALTRANLEEARRSVLDLRAASLEGQTLTQALHALATEVERESGGRVACEITGSARPLPARIETGLYRIAREAMTNVARHAHAPRARLSLVMTPEEARLVIEDNGRGFDPAEAPQGRYGLRGMSERARLLGGALRVATSPGEGTRIEAVIPLRARV